MISARLNKVIKIEKGVQGKTSVGSPILVWEEYMTPYANVYVRSGDVRYNENEELVYTVEFEVRYNELSKDITNKYRIVYNNQTYRITQIIETETRHAIKLIGVLFYGE